MPPVPVVVVLVRCVSGPGTAAIPEGMTVDKVGAPF